MATTKPLAAIVRSSDGVAERQKAGTYHGDEEQVAEVERYVTNLPSKPPIVWMEPELDVSGGKPIDKRPALLAAIEGVEDGTYGGIVVAYLSRLTRSHSGRAIWDRVEAVGGHVHAARENLDTSTARGRFVRDLFLDLAVLEREEHSERFAERRKKTVEAGVWRVRQVPRGYAFAGPVNEAGKFKGEEARRLVPGPDVEDLRQAFRDHGRGVSIVAIADRLGMTPSGVRQMLKNRVYLGELRDGPNLKLNAHEALVTEAEFEAAQRSVPRAPRSMVDGPALLAGLVRCASCGHIMSRRATKQVIYGCAVHHSGGRCPKPASITTANLDAYVESVALPELDRLAVSASEGRGVQRAEDAVANAELELSALMKTITAAGLDAGDRDLAHELRVRKQAIEDARECLRLERQRQPVLPVAGMSGADVWEGLDATERNLLLRNLLAAVVVAPAGGRGRRVPIEDRVRVLAYGTDVKLPDQRPRAEKPLGIVPIPLPDVSTLGVLAA
jgi:site-specific DNA recombinase